MRRNEKRWKEETRKRGKGEKVDGEDLQAKKLKKYQLEKKHQPSPTQMTKELLGDLSKPSC